MPKATTVMNWTYLLTDFHGRIGRRQFWIAMAVVSGASFLACLGADYVGGDRLSAIVALAFVYPEFAVAIKRANDRKLPVWVLVAFFIATTAFDLLFVMLGWTTDATTSLIVTIPIAALGAYLLVELGFRRGIV
jgi:uncharacterized membrane protein YhaH (DUF805 family)